MSLTLEQWRSRQVEKYKHTQLAKHYDSAKREWISIDGEGWGRDESGRQYYRFMIAATEQGFQMKTEPKERDSLTTQEALDWLSSIPYNYRLYCKKNNIEFHQPLIGGFALGYDYAHILIDITQEQLESLLSFQDFESPPTKITDRYSVKLTAGNLRIYANDRLQQGINLELVNIWDTFKYYQAAFLKVMKAYATQEQWAIIEEGKNRRNQDESHDIATEVVYCLNECRVHSRAMNDLSRAIHEIGLNPRGWYGPGSLASSAMTKHKTKSYWKSDDEQPQGLRLAARHAYIGGRFETTGHGWLPRMYSHDIRSAYPAAMINLPCLLHGSWSHLTGSEAEQAMNSQEVLCVGLVDWDASNPSGGWGPYPVRASTRSIDKLSGSTTKLPNWPFNGQNWLWNQEYQAGRFLTQSVDITEAWIYQQQCRCHPFDWVHTYYDWRAKLREEGNDIGEKVVKLILNSGYGKIAQTIGNPPVPSWIWAGLITQSARSQLLIAIQTQPDSCIMVATDAVYSTAPLELNFGASLGQWDGPDEYGRTLIIQAGFWRDYDDETGKNQKTRGIAKRYLESKWPVFQELWTDILRENLDINRAVVPIKYSDHIGLQRARQYGIEKLGIWTDDAYQDIRFKVDKRPHLIGQPDINGWWRSAPTRNNRVGEQLELEVTVSDQYIAEERSAMDKYFIVEQPDAAEWGYSDD